MHEKTSSSLLCRVQAHDPEGWRQLCRVYGPTVYGWARRTGLQDSDAADIVQEVFQAVSKAISGFRREQQGDTFQGWLRTITQNKVRDLHRRRVKEVAAQGGSAAHQQIESIEVPPITPAESAQIKLRTLELLRSEFREDTWRQFWRVAVEGDTPQNVADDLGVSVWVVYKTKARVLARLREALTDLL